MQLITILLVTVSALAFLSGIAVLVGASRSSKFHSFSFFMTALGVFGWALSMAIFMSSGDGDAVLTKVSVFGIYISTLVMDLFFMIYVGNKLKASRIPVFIAVIGSLVFGIALLYKPELLYTGVVVDGASNAVKIRLGWWYVGFSLFTMFEGSCVALLVWHRIRHSNNEFTKKGWTVFLATLSVAWVGAGVFDLILPVFRYDLIWIGPLLISLDFVVHYYSILKYHLIELASGWMKALSHIIVMTLAAVVYLSAFFVIFVSLFKVSSPSGSVLLLNTIMVVLVLILFPAINEISAYTRSLASVQSVDIVYLVKKFNMLSREYINYHELAEFLVEHLHFQYVGLLIDGKLYGSKIAKLSAGEVKEIEKAKNAKGMWVKFEGEQREELKKRGVEAVAVLKNHDGSETARVLIGKPFGGINFNSRDLGEVETALTLLSVAIASGERFKG